MVDPFTLRDSIINFAEAVPDNGYRWWYVDALSDDGRAGITIIAFVGSVFSPYYAWRRDRGPTPAIEHCALNIALYQPGANRWAMTERGARHVERSARVLQIGPSQLRWEDDRLCIEFDERCAPIPRRLRGRVTLHPLATHAREYSLDRAGRHRWQPIAPQANVEVELSHPGLAWSGHGYLDSNGGSEPIADAFVRWDWSRCRMPDGGTAVLYDLERRGSGDATAEPFNLSLLFEGAQDPALFPAAPIAALPDSAWGIARATRCEANARPAFLTSFEDGPFYSRASLRTTLLGQSVTAMHESLSLDRLRKSWVQCLLPFRMPRKR